MFVRRFKNGVSRIKRDTYNTNQYGVEEKNFWWRISKEVRERDRNKCIWCGSPARDVHHILPLSRGGTNTKSNLACICDICHSKRPYHKHMETRKIKREDPF